MDTETRFTAAERGISTGHDPVGVLTNEELWLVFAYRELDTDGRIEAMDAVAEIRSRRGRALHVVGEDPHGREVAALYRGMDTKRRYTLLGAARALAIADEIERAERHHDEREE